MLIPMYFLIGIWGDERRIYAAIKFFLYTMAGSVLMLVAILVRRYLHSRRPGSYTLRPAEAAATCRCRGTADAGSSLAFALAFAIKVPLFPFHTWLPDAHVEAPTAGSVILAGVLLKMGTYGLLRFAFPLFPDGGRRTSRRCLAMLAVIGIVYGALVAMVQPDMKKLVAYSSVSHLGFVVLGIFAMNIQGVQGAVYQMLNHGVSHRRPVPPRRHDLRAAAHAPDRGVRRPEARRCRSWWRPSSSSTLSSIGLPGLNGFVGEFLILFGAFRWNPALDGGGRERRDPRRRSTCSGCSSA